MRNTILVNKQNKFNNNFINYINLVTIKNIYNNEILIEENTYKAFLELKKYLETIGIIIGIDNAYRNVEEQTKLYREYEKKYGDEHRNSYVAYPGYSEHHTGLAIDISLKINDNWTSEDDEINNYEDIFSRIHDVLYKFGFILRYPKGKEKITGYNYEPWHLRYVSKTISKLIKEYNYETLEEYIEQFSGVLIVNKNKGVTSFDIVKEISNLYGIKKVGHTGTLDPIATGVLVVCLGKATKLVEELTSMNKEYIATVKLGILTDTLDTDGNVLWEEDISLNKENLNEVLNSFIGQYMQEVPSYSAVKINGKKLYEYARNGEKIELPKRLVTIKNIELINCTEKEYSFKVEVSKGTYIRSLIRDINKKLGIIGSMSNLKRTKQGNFDIEKSYDLNDIKSGNSKILSIEDVLKNNKCVIIDDTLFNLIRNGRIIENKYNEKKVAFIYNGKVISIYKEYEKDNSKMKPYKMFI